MDPLLPRTIYKEVTYPMYVLSVKQDEWTIVRVERQRRSDVYVSVLDRDYRVSPESYFSSSTRLKCYLLFLPKSLSDIATDVFSM